MSQDPMKDAIAAILDIASEDEHLLVQYAWQVGDEVAEACGSEQPR